MYYERRPNLPVAVLQSMMPALTLAADAPTVRYEPFGDVATTTWPPSEVSFEALRLRDIAADALDHFNLWHLSLGRHFTMQPAFLWSA
jgi:hypothetical protein